MPPYSFSVKYFKLALYSGNEFGGDLNLGDFMNFVLVRKTLKILGDLVR